MLKSAEQFLLWLGDFVEDAHSGKPSVKRFGLALTVTVLCVVMAALGTVIAHSILISTGHDKVEMVRSAGGTLEVLAFMVLSAVTGSYLVDKNSARKAAKDEDIPERPES